MSERAVIVFTFKSVERLLREGGSAAWRLDPGHARKCSYAVCTRNANSKRSEGHEPHRDAFLVGKIQDVVPAYKRPDRYLIRFSEYALVTVPNAWKGGRNPVSYGTLEQLGIDPAALTWEPMPEPEEAAEPAEPSPVRRGPVGPLTIAEAKHGLAQTFGVAPEAIEITIRG
jgi:hypothetical protein